MRLAIASVVALVMGCTRADGGSSPEPAELRVDFIRRSVSDVLEGVVTAGTGLDVVELVEVNNTTRLAGFAPGGNRPFSLVVSGLAEGEHPLLIRGSLSGKFVELSTSFTVDRTRPGLRSQLPSRLVIGESILVSFSEPVDVQSLASGLRVEGGDSWSWAAVDESTLRIFVEWGFRAPGVVRVMLSSQVTDRAGLGLVAPGQHDVEFVDDADAGDLVWAASPMVVGPPSVAMLQPRSALLSCRGVFNQSRLQHELRFVDGGSQTTDLPIEGLGWVTSSCSAWSGPNGEILFVHVGRSSIDVLSGTGPASTFRQIGPTIPFGASLGTQATVARFADGRLLTTDGSRTAPVFWLFDGQEWRRVPGPPGGTRFISMQSYRESVGLLLSTIDPLAPMTAWVWRNERWQQVGAVPSGSSCCVSSDRLVCLNRDSTIVEVNEMDAGVIGRSTGSSSAPVVFAQQCDEVRAVWLFGDDIVELRGDSVTTVSGPRAGARRIWAFRDGTTWFDNGVRMFRAAKH